ncbi:hypothetical protein BDV12DRAFT_207197 [Aspergillus spectabilis]
MSPPSESSSSSSVLSNCSLSSSSSDGSSSPQLPHRTATPPTNSQTTSMFIDCQADNAQNCALKKEKQAFVLNRYFRKKRQAAIERLKPCKPSPSALHLEFTSRHTLSTLGHAAAVGDKDKKSQQNSDTFNSIARHEVSSLKQYLGQGYTDPFSSVAVEMTDSIYAYFHHYKLYTIQACYPLDAGRESIWWWQKAITQPALFHALLFLAAGHQAMLESTSGLCLWTVQKSRRDSLCLRGNSLKVLKNIMQDPTMAVKESTAFAVAALVAIEAVNANFSALDAHMKGLRRLIHLLGGLEPLDHRLLSKLYLIDVKRGALTNTRPYFPILPRWRREILQYSKIFQITGQEDPSTPNMLSTLGHSIFNAPWYTELELTMQGLLRIFSRLIIYYETATLCPSLIMPTDNDLFILFEYQLLLTSYTSTTTGNKAKINLDLDKNNLDLNEPLRLTLLIYLNNRIWHLQPFPFMEYMCEALKRRLLETNTFLPYFESVAPDLLFWILFMGGLASQGFTCHGWFVNNLVKTVGRLGLENWEKARRVLGGFFYICRQDERRAEEALWNEVLVKEVYQVIAPKPQIAGT